MADTIRDELLWICHTAGLNEDGVLDGDILADAVLSSSVVARIRAEAWDEGALHELNEWAPPYSEAPKRIRTANPYRGATDV